MTAQEKQAKRITNLATSAVSQIIDKAPLHLSRFVAANRAFIVTAIEVEVTFMLADSIPSINIPRIAAREYIEASGEVTA